MVLFISPILKQSWTPIIDMFLRLLTNAPRSANESQRGKRGLVRQKDQVGKFWSTPVPTSLPMKLAISSSITTTMKYPHVNVYLFKLPKKRIYIYI